MTDFQQHPPLPAVDFRFDIAEHSDLDCGWFSHLLNTSDVASPGGAVNRPGDASTAVGNGARVEAAWGERVEAAWGETSEAASRDSLERQLVSDDLWETIERIQNDIPPRDNNDPQKQQKHTHLEGVGGVGRKVKVRRIIILELSGSEDESVRGGCKKRRFREYLGEDAEFKGLVGEDAEFRGLVGEDADDPVSGRESESWSPPLAVPIHRPAAGSAAAGSATAAAAVPGNNVRENSASTRESPPPSPPPLPSTPGYPAPGPQPRQHAWRLITQPTNGHESESPQPPPPSPSPPYTPIGRLTPAFRTLLVHLVQTLGCTSLSKDTRADLQTYWRPQAALVLGCMHTDIDMHRVGNFVAREVRRRYPSEEERRVAAGRWRGWVEGMANREASG